MFAAAPAPASGLSPAEMQSLLTTPRLENKIFWPTLAAISVLLAVRNRLVLLDLLGLPTSSVSSHILRLLEQASCGLLNRNLVSLDFSQAMIIISIVLPAMLADRTADMMRGVFLCFAFALIVNVFVVLGQTPDNRLYWRDIGYPGYFTFKGILGECAAIAFLLSLHEMLYPGWRRVLGVIVIVIATWLMFVSQSKGSLGFAILAPLLAALTLFIARKMRFPRRPFYCPYQFATTYCLDYT